MEEIKLNKGVVRFPYINNLYALRNKEFFLAYRKSFDPHFEGRINYKKAQEAFYKKYGYHVNIHGMNYTYINFIYEGNRSVDDILCELELMHEENQYSLARRSLRKAWR